MKAVLDRVRDLDLVLKGGSALVFTRSLNHHSTQANSKFGTGIGLGA